ncbi:unnamed protein product, partial [Ilex paraguariensis]
HGIFQLLSGWADGPEYATQCPILTGQSYTYRFTITGQEGTLWWHAHVQWLRATVYGALIIRPRVGRSYPFPKPYSEVPIVLGEWWNANVIDVENQALASGGAPNISNAFTINGRPGDLYPCSSSRLAACGANATCAGPFGQRLAASMNNASFQFPTKLSMLQAFFNNVDGIYTTDFPNQPPLVFDYTNANNSFNQSLVMTTKSTKVKKVKFNSTVEMVMQNTALIGVENHPIHLHGFNFHVLAQGFGNFDTVNDRKKFNLVNPQQRNTIAVPVGGWAVVRFQANNPGVWLMHCHLDVHLPWGLATAFVVENGGTPSSTLPPPPPDLPHC